MIFMGPLFNREDESIIKEKTVIGGVQNQANTFQWHCIDGLIENGEDVHIMNVLPVGTYRKYYKDAILHTKKWVYRNAENIEIGCINLPVLKQLSRMRNCKECIPEIDDKTIIIYSTYLPFLKAVSQLPDEYKVVLIVTDLPEFYDYGAKVGGLRRCLRKINNRSLYKCFDRIDGFVLLTEAMHSALNVGERPYVIIEGICDAPAGIDLPVSRSDTDIKRILYTGTINRKFGIVDLVEAFQRIPAPDYRLQICGAGDYEEELKEKAKTDKRIEYYGFVNRSEAVELQKQATVLVNPRSNSGEYTKYSFPSKTMEYLQSGVPTIACKLDGIPDDYDEYINYFSEGKNDTLSDVIYRVCEDKTGKYSEKARRARDYVANEKNHLKQAKKIIELIDRL